MQRRSNEEFDYDDEDYEDDRRGVRKLKREPDGTGKKKKWDRESFYDRDHDYDERR